MLKAGTGHYTFEGQQMSKQMYKDDMNLCTEHIKVCLWPVFHWCIDGLQIKNKVNAAVERYLALVLLLPSHVQSSSLTCSAFWLLLSVQLFLLSAGPLSSAACPPLQISPWEALALERLVEKRGTAHHKDLSACSTADTELISLKVRLNMF